MPSKEERERFVREYRELCERHGICVFYDCHRNSMWLIRLQSSQHGHSRDDYWDELINHDG